MPRPHPFSCTCSPRPLCRPLSEQRVWGASSSQRLFLPLSFSCISALRRLGACLPPPGPRAAHTPSLSLSPLPPPCLIQARSVPRHLLSGTCTPAQHQLCELSPQECAWAPLGYPQPLGADTRLATSYPYGRPSPLPPWGHSRGST